MTRQVDRLITRLIAALTRALEKQHPTQARGNDKKTNEAHAGTHRIIKT